MNKGTVKWFNNQKGYGFIVGEDGKDVFVHHTNIIADGFRTLSEGQSVTYDTEMKDGKVQAVNVTAVA
jgi:CspA family cold shock protein